MAFPSGQWPRAVPNYCPARLVMGFAAADRNGSLQSRRNEKVAGILEDQNDGGGGA
jgi:hypothetical protein